MLGFKEYYVKQSTVNIALPQVYKVNKPNEDAEALPRLLFAVQVYSPVSPLTA